MWGRGAYFIGSGCCVSIFECRSGVGAFKRRVGGMFGRLAFRSALYWPWYIGTLDI